MRPVKLYAPYYKRKSRNNRHVGPDLETIYRHIEAIGHGLLYLSTEFEDILREARRISQREFDRRNLGRFFSNYTVRTRVNMQVKTDSLQDFQLDRKRCANCNYNAVTKCSICRKTSYCSLYCQNKDWVSHQMVCLNSIPTAHTEPQHNQPTAPNVGSQVE